VNVTVIGTDWLAANATLAAVEVTDDTVAAVESLTYVVILVQVDALPAASVTCAKIVVVALAVSAFVILVAVPILAPAVPDIAAEQLLLLCSVKFETVSDRVTVIVGVVLPFGDVGEIELYVTVGVVVSTTKALVPAILNEPPTPGSVKLALLPVASLMVPPLSASEPVFR
jgi:hypothetical protein